MAFNVITSGVNTSFSTELNDNFNQTGVVEIYTSTGFDSTQSGGAGATAGSHELTAVASATYDYVKVVMTGKAVLEGGTNNRVELKAQIKETGGSYADILAYAEVLKISASADDTSSTTSYTFYYALTSGMQTNGYQIQLFSNSATASADGSATYTNVQTVVEKMN